MASFSRLVRFESEQGGGPYFADLGPGNETPPPPGAKLEAFTSYEALVQQSGKRTVTVRRVSYLCTTSPLSAICQCLIVNSCWRHWFEMGYQYTV